MPKITKHPGVSIPSLRGETFEAVFYHPLERRRVRRSTGEATKVAAVAFATSLSALLHSPDDWVSPPDRYPQLVRRAWARAPMPERFPLSVSSRFSVMDASVNASLASASGAPGLGVVMDAKSVERMKNVVKELEEARAEIAALKSRLAAFSAGGS